MRIEETLYQAYHSLAAYKHQSISVLIRRALEEYLDKEQKSEHSIFDMKTYKVGKVLIPLEEMDRSEIFDEMIRGDE